MGSMINLSRGSEPRGRLSPQARVVALLITVGLTLPGIAAGQQAPVTPDVVYGHKDGMALTYDVLHPDGSPNGAGVLWMVSGGWISRWAPPRMVRARFTELLDEGFTVFVVRHGSSPRYKVPDAVADVRRAARHIRTNANDFSVDPERLGVYGGSAGGHLSLMLGLAAESDAAGLAAVVAYFPPVDLRRIAGPSERFPALDFEAGLAPSISPILFVTPDDPPVLLIHGDADELVGLANSESMYAALQDAGVSSELIVIPGGDHGFTEPQHRARANAAMVAWFAEHLQ